ncbi:hypothetical protein FHK02_1199 [Spirosoma sp. LMG 31448]|uniref:Uncharacterized protein n=1 Tax=Spirosoma utsteinense TaxID=2585773 RepID=A0ABR6W5D3_9BACT|nr:hypothetical protein [Spirosoma utsteinense]MBC3791201.1 hypothetical protein [Spirosoma utsteinense]
MFLILFIRDLGKLLLYTVAALVMATGFVTFVIPTVIVRYTLHLLSTGSPADVSC